MNLDTQPIAAVAACFGIHDTCTDISIIESGHINCTYKVSFEKPDGQTINYLFQKINLNVFKDPDKLMHNIVAVTAHLRKKIIAAGGNPERETLTFLQAVDGKYYTVCENNAHWRVCNFVDNTYSCDSIDNNEVFFNSGAAFGRFQRLLSDFDGSTLYETIPDFHNTKKRFEALQEAIKNDIAHRADSVRDEIAFALAREKDCSVLVDMIADGALPLRVTHNDTKLNNILFDNDTNEGICIVDLDTVMPGLSLYDFGDSIRFGANTAAEDEKDVSKVALSLPLYESYVSGYLSTAGSSLTSKEIELLPFSAKLMTYECGIRFLTDYLNGDTYFKIHYPEHNLVRCHTQFALVADIERKLEQMSAITAKAAALYKD